MRIDDICAASPWIEEKLISKHNISMLEAEQALLDHVDLRRVGRDDRGDMRYSAIGQTWAGRWIILVFVMRPNHVAAVLMARDSTPAERALARRRM